MHERSHVPLSAPIAVPVVPKEYEGDALRTMVHALPQKDAALAQSVSTPLYNLGCSEWVIGKLYCRKARQAADGSLHFHMILQREEPAGAAPIALPHEYSLQDLAYLRLVDDRTPLNEKDRHFGTFGVAQ